MQENNIDHYHLRLLSVSSQLYSFSVLMKGFNFPETQRDDLAGFGLALEKLAEETQEIADQLGAL